MSVSKVSSIKLAGYVKKVEGGNEYRKSVYIYKGRDANKPCPCNSGKKIKRCCGTQQFTRLPEGGKA